MQNNHFCVVRGCLIVSSFFGALAVAVSTPVYSAELKLYYSIAQDSFIRRTNLNGSQTETLVEGLNPAIPDIAFDPPAQKLYWPSAEIGGIQRADYNGANVETVFTGIGLPSNLAIDAVNRKVYWFDYDTVSSLYRSNLDGTDRELLATTFGPPTDIEVDPIHGYYYWSEQLDGTIHRTSFDNLDSSVIFDKSAFGSPGLPEQMAIDPKNGYLYATDIAFQAIVRMGLDGSNPILWVTQGVHDPHGIVVNPINQRVIWSNDGNQLFLHIGPNVSSVNFQGADERTDFIPEWYAGSAAAFVRHLALVEIPAPEPITFSLGVIAGVTFSCFARLRSR